MLRPMTETGIKLTIAPSEIQLIAVKGDYSAFNFIHQEFDFIKCMDH